MERAHCLAELFGFKLPKGQAPTESISILGAHVSRVPGEVTAFLHGRNRGALFRDLERVPSAGALAPAHSDKLRGRLGFAYGRAFGKFGRV